MNDGARSSVVHARALIPRMNQSNDHFFRTSDLLLETTTGSPLFQRLMPGRAARGADWRGPLFNWGAGGRSATCSVRASESTALTQERKFCRH